MIELASFQASEVKVFLRMLATSPELDTLLIHVSDVFGGEIGVCIIDILQKLVEISNIHWIEILSMLQIQIPRPGCADLGMVFLESVDPAWAWENTTDVKHKGIYFISVEWLCNNSLIANPIHKCCLL